VIQFLPGDKGAKAEVEAAVERLKNARGKRAARKKSRMKRPGSEDARRVYSKLRVA
jgi:hypothetical protein